MEMRATLTGLVDQVKTLAAEVHSLKEEVRLGAQAQLEEHGEGIEEGSEQSSWDFFDR